MKQIFFHSKYKYLACLFYGLIVIIFYIASYGVTLYNFIDCFFIAGFSLLCVGGLSICTQHGSFDIFSYAVSNKGSGANRITFYDYQEKKKEKRKKYQYGFIPYLVVGGFFTITSIILLIVFNMTLPEIPEQTILYLLY